MRTLHQAFFLSRSHPRPSRRPSVNQIANRRKLIRQRQPHQRGIQQRPARLRLADVAAEFFQNRDVLRQRAGVERLRLGANPPSTAPALPPASLSCRTSAAPADSADDRPAPQSAHRPTTRMASDRIGLPQRGLDTPAWPMASARSNINWILGKPSNCSMVSHRQLGFADAQQPIQQRQRIAHRSRARLGHQQQGIFIGLDLFVLANVFQMLGDLAGWEYCGNHTAGSATRIVGSTFSGSVVARMNFTWLRRLFQRLQQRVKRAVWRACELRR